MIILSVVYLYDYFCFFFYVAERGALTIYILNKYI